MKKSSKFLLLGIAFIAYGIFSAVLTAQGEDLGWFWSIPVGIGIFSPFIGLVLAIIGFFIKDE